MFDEMDNQLGFIRWLCSLPESFAWYDRTLIDEVRFVRRPYGMLLVLKGRRKNKQNWTMNVVSFTEGADIHDCLTNLANALRTGNIRWSEDKYPPNVGS